MAGGLWMEEGGMRSLRGPLVLHPPPLLRSYLDFHLNAECQGHGETGIEVAGGRPLCGQFWTESPSWSERWPDAGRDPALIEV